MTAGQELRSLDSKPTFSSASNEDDGQGGMGGETLRAAP